LIIIDAQVHIWNAGNPSPHHLRGRPDPFTVDDLQREMEAAGVDGAVLAPPSWDPNGNQPSLDAAKTSPNRFAVTGDLDWRAAPDPQRLENWRRSGMRGLRLIFNTPDKQSALTNGTVEWIWQTAERVDLPIMLLVPGALAHVAQIGDRHPHLRLCVDHLGIPRGAKDAAAFEHLPTLLALARRPNISVKAGGIPSYSTIDTYPYPSLQAPLRQVYDAFGPERIFWASDLTRMTCPYREVVTLFSEAIPWLSPADRRLILGESVCRWLGWTPCNS
jgi:predicted TIM-barrel fold metal-dependent hydrolase